MVLMCHIHGCCLEYVECKPIEGHFVLCTLCVLGIFEVMTSLSNI